MNHEPQLQQLIKLSRRYGSDHEYVLLGGGNTSWKHGEVMYVKASGYALQSIDREGFAGMDRSQLDAVWEKQYPADPARREEAVLQDMMEARLPGEENRPSVEALLHSLIPYAFTVHLHPALVNGMTCGRQGAERMEELFGTQAVWVPCTDPGYVLAAAVRDQARRMQDETGTFPPVIFLENHGVFVGAETADGITAWYDRIMDTLKSQVQRFPDLEPESIDPQREEALQRGISRGLSGDIKLYGLHNRELARFLSSAQAAAPVSSAFTPDHIVYSGHKPLWIDAQTLASRQAEDSIAELTSAYCRQEGVPPKAALAEQTGAFGIGSSVRQAESAALVFLDTVKVAVYSESFGGPSFMPEEQIRFIREWEVEKYRSRVHDTKE